MSNYPGDTIILPITYKVDGTLTDPTSVKISVIDPLGETLVTLATATHDSTGQYHYDYTFASDAITGDYTFTWSITVGAVVTTYSQIIELDLPPVSTHYADKTTIKNDLKAHDNSIKTDDYAIVDSAINKAEIILNGKLGLLESLQQADISAAQWRILLEAANLLAETWIMDNLYSKGDKRSQTAIAFEKQADTILTPYMAG